MPFSLATNDKIDWFLFDMKAVKLRQAEQIFPVKHHHLCQLQLCKKNNVVMNKISRKLVRYAL